MEAVYKFVIDIMKKNLYTTIITGFSLFVVMPIAFLYFNKRYFLDNGISYILFWGLALHVCATACWWKISENFFKTLELRDTLKNNSKEFDWDQKKQSRSFTIAVGSFSATFFGLVGIGICYWFELPFLWYLIILYSYALLRLIISYYDIYHYKNLIKNQKTKP